MKVHKAVIFPYRETWSSAGSYVKKDVTVIFTLKLPD